jgi:hypothetical protein
MALSFRLQYVAARPRTCGRAGVAYEPAAVAATVAAVVAAITAACAA